MVKNRFFSNIKVYTKITVFITNESLYKKSKFCRVRIWNTKFFFLFKVFFQVIFGTWDPLLGILPEKKNTNVSIFISLNHLDQMLLHDDYIFEILRKFRIFVTRRAFYFGPYENLNRHFIFWKITNFRIILNFTISVTSSQICHAKIVPELQILILVWTLTKCRNFIDGEHFLN